MKKTTLSKYRILCILFTYILFAQISLGQVETKPIINATLQGVVIDDETKQPIEGVTIQLEAVTHSVKTDDKGRFQFVTGQKLPFTLLLSYVGYERQRIVIGIDGGCSAKPDV